MSTKKLLKNLGYGYAISYNSYAKKFQIDNTEFMVFVNRDKNWSIVLLERNIVTGKQIGRAHV